MNCVQHQDRVNLDNEDLIFCSTELSKKLGLTERKSRLAIQDASGNGSDNKAFYTGQWKIDTDTRQGHGLLERTNGEYYAGFFFNNKFHGLGRFTFAPDDAYLRKDYTGPFEDGEFHGHGTLTLQCGDSLKGRWVHGSLKGQGKF